MLRFQSMDADVTLAGNAYAGLSGSNVALQDGSGSGRLAGVAYERPVIAMRIAVTYFSAVTNSFNQTKTIDGVPISLLPGPANPFGVDG